MSSGTSLSLTFNDWPAKLQENWNSAIAPAIEAFDDQTRVATWGYRTQQQARLSLGRWLQWLVDQGIDIGQADIMASTTEEELTRFFLSELNRAKFGSVRNTAVQLVGVLQSIGSGVALPFAPGLLRRLRRHSRRDVPAARHIEHGRTLYRAGLEAMEGELETGEALERFRNGLCVALLAAAPMRIKNFAEIEIDRHLLQDASGWIIHLNATETKTRRPDRWPVPKTLERQMACYLEDVRPVLIQRGRAGSTHRLWIGKRGEPVSDQTVRKWIKELTAKKFGDAVLPHSFRHAAAVTLTLERPTKAVEAAALLGHASSQTTEKHYILQKEMRSRVEFLELLEALRSPK